MRAGVAASVRPRIATIELSNQREPAILAGIQMPSKFGDLAAGGDGYAVMAAATDRVRTILDVEALESYLAVHSPAKAPVGGRIIKQQ